jgi:catechol 2,3-dioxygenase-like lactoylglutathione lyase family enzyme
MELFVDDLDVSVGFYRTALGFRVERHDEVYVSVRRGSVVVGSGQRDFRLVDPRLLPGRDPQRCPHGATDRLCIATAGHEPVLDGPRMAVCG